MMMFTKHSAAFPALAAMSLALTGCVSIGAGAEPPASLLTLSATTGDTSTGEARAATAGQETMAIAVLTPETPAKLDIVRVPVNVSDTEVAYLQNAIWVEKPARLFRRLVGETLRERVGAESIVLDTNDTPVLATVFVRGTLLELSYDAQSSSVIARYQGVITSEEGGVFSRRFEAREEGVPADVAFVGPALNRVANEVADDVADWVITGQ